MPTTIEQDLKSTLSGITLYPDAIPSDATFPNAVYQQVSELPVRHHGGNALRRIRYQITVYGKTKNSSVTLANSIKATLDLNQTDFKLATKQNEFSTKEAESGLYATVLEFFIWTDK